MISWSFPDSRTVGPIIHIMHTENAPVAIQTIPLTDEEAVRASLEPLALPHLHPNELRTPNPPYWARYLRDRSPQFTWHGQTDVWVQAKEEAGLLLQVVISGLQDEQEAKFLRSEFRRRQARVEELNALVADVISTRDRRAHQETFKYYLENVRDYFEWENGQAVESGGFFTGLPVSKSNLVSDDIALLRGVFERLPRTLFNPVTLREDSPESLGIRDEPCPLCGGKTKTKREIVKKLKVARDKVKALSTQLSDEGFKAWLGERVQDKTEKWMRPTALYEDYASWIRTHGKNKGERSEAKRTAMSQKKWGALMRKSYDYRRDGNGGFYRAALKRQKHPE